MAYQIKILTVTDSEDAQEMSQLRTESSDSEHPSHRFVQTMNVERERAKRLREEIGKVMSFEDFFDLMTEVLF